MNFLVVVHVKLEEKEVRPLRHNGPLEVSYSVVTVYVNSVELVFFVNVQIQGWMHLSIGALAYNML